MIRNVVVICFAVAFCAFAVWATFSGNLQKWIAALEAIPYPVTFVILILIIMFMNMPFGYGYSVVCIASGFGFGWKGLPPILIGGLLLGPWAAYGVNQCLFFRGKTPEELVHWIPNAQAKRLVRAVILGVRLDRCSVLIVAATRTSPLAVGLQVIILSAAAPPLLSFAIGMFIGGMPDLILSVYIGTLVRSATDEASGGATKQADSVKLILIVAQLLACFLLMGLVSFAARRMLKKYDSDEPIAESGAVEPAAAERAAS